MQTTSPTASRGRFSGGDAARSSGGDTARSLFNQIEADLLNSEVYQSLSTNLHEVAGETVEAVQHLMQAFGREAIRLTFQQIAQNYHVTPSTLKKKVVPIHSKNGQASVSAENTPVQKPSKFVNTPAKKPTEPSSRFQPKATDTASPAQDQETSASESSESRSFSFPRRITKAQRIKMLIEERNTTCHNIGKTLKEARQAQAISFGELHSKTLVQICFIKALEEGQLDKLPEDTYLRGFILRIGNALGLDGNALAQSLPKPTKEEEDVIPSWYSPTMHPGKGGSMDLPSLNAYLGYTAVVAGAIGGLAWASGQHTGFEAAQIDTDEQPMTEYQSNSEKYSSLNAVTEDISNAEIAPPEMTN
ncbi:helix-turn-helix domain-containing protein [Spirulina sp. CS-785/01]|uniref:helix-turn-helix domain-containing protein n=1 Tax=Spirulina sp. CS-785/01 TaxID=3021716 RepID=UPI0023301CA5|nr:helix-turn-helix domain-containing protein [Spirulina sp. CS-785/01]